MNEISLFYSICIKISNEAILHRDRLFYSNLEIALSSITVASLLFLKTTFPDEVRRVLYRVYNCTYYDFDKAFKFVYG